MYRVRPTTKFQKDLKRIEKRGYNITLITDIIKKSANGERCLKRTGTTAYQVIMQGAENVISRLIGY